VRAGSARKALLALGLLAACSLAQGPPALAAPAASGDQQTVIAAAAKAAEAMQGPLDGLWRLTDGRGDTLFVFDLADPGGPPAPLAADPDKPGVEGAWREPGRAGAPGALGLVDQVRRAGARVRLSFVEGARAQPRTVSLTRGRGGRWSGVLSAEGARRRVVMTRF
jgi:hypothetical protein